MLFLVKLNPEYSSKLLVEAKGTCELFLFLIAAKKKAFFVSFRWDTKILTADRTVGSAAVCKDIDPTMDMPICEFLADTVVCHATSLFTCCVMIKT